MKYKYPNFTCRTSVISIEIKYRDKITIGYITGENSTIHLEKSKYLTLIILIIRCLYTIYFLFNVVSIVCLILHSFFSTMYLSRARVLSSYQSRLPLSLLLSHTPLPLRHACIHAHTHTHARA